tara:strand:- start:2255 stop:3148 length:894 start_codon:yes stop_codon:yes gene_type:complete
MQQIFKNQIVDPIFAYPSRIDLRWSRAFVRVQTPAVAMPDESTWTLATFDNVSRSVAGSSDEGTFRISLNPLGAGGSISPGYQYVVEPADNNPNFVITVARVVSTTLLEVQDPLPQNVPTGSFIYGIRASVELEPEQVKNVGQCIARWRVEDRDRRRYDWDQPFLIVNTHTNYSLNSSTLERMYPMVQRLRPDDTQLEELIETAWRNYVRPDIEGKGMKSNQIKSWERLEPAHGAACVLHLVLTDERQDPEYRETWRTEYAHQMDLLFAGVRFWYDEKDGTVPTRSDYDYSGRSILR